MGEIIASRSLRNHGESIQCAHRESVCQRSGEKATQYSQFHPQDGAQNRQNNAERAEKEYERVSGASGAYQRLRLPPEDPPRPGEPLSSSPSNWRLSRPPPRFGV